jgi:thiamine biosynthesis protein ThiS
MEMTGTITLNGQPSPAPTPLAVDALLAHLGLTGKPVVVELDQQPVFPRDYSQTLVQNGARVEIVTLAAGG